MSFIDSKYIGLVSSRLQKFTERKKGLYNFRCPYCGDSQKHKNKTRGYIYQYKNDHNFKCHNCGMSKSFTYFLKDLDTCLYDQYVMERYKNGLTGKGSNTPDPDFNFQKPEFFKKTENSESVKIVDLPTLEELNKEHSARKYVEQRQIPKKFYADLYYCEKFKEWTNTQKYTFESTDQDEPRIIIPLINHGKLFGFQGRSLNKNSKVKYITIILDEHHPKIYGLDKIDWEKTVYITEGPFDSMFLNNSIAMVGADFDRMFFITNFQTDFVMVYDNEKRNKQIVERIEKAIDSNFPVVIWPSDVPEKDINDMIISGRNVQSMIESNTYSGLEAKTKLISWKRV
jgi:transcription elongation factor Elf1